MGGLIFPVWVYLEVVAWRAARRRRERARAAAIIAASVEALPFPVSPSVTATLVH
jgi:hypothetical protein